MSRRPVPTLLPQNQNHPKRLLLLPLRQLSHRSLLLLRRLQPLLLLNRFRRRRPFPRTLSRRDRSQFLSLV